jgi:cell division cycle 14
MIVRFIQQLDAELAAWPSCMLFYCVDEGPRALTNAVFLLGSYMMLKLQNPLDEVLDCFSWTDKVLIEGYRDATFSIPTFRLTLEDCWRGLAKGMDNGWVRLPQTYDYAWGMIDIDEYSHYDDPLNGDMHEVVPGKFIALKGPRDFGGDGAMLHSDSEGGYRCFSPSYYIDIFNDFGVKTVVRLNEAEYDPGALAEHGFAVVDLYFDDCTPPPPNTVQAFLAAVDESGESAVAVHCKAGLGRTGTLIALYLMRSCGFSSREAMGWLRIMRPGSVIGTQQHYLCAIEHAMAAAVQAGAASEAKGADSFLRSRRSERAPNHFPAWPAQ